MKFTQGYLTGPLHAIGGLPAKVMEKSQDADHTLIESSVKAKIKFMIREQLFEEGR